MEIRKITVELLRAGPRHNQLLSPLTQYLGVCGDSQAGIVTIPYEHASFERRLSELRYSVSSADDSEARLGILGLTGGEIAQILGSIPGLSGSLQAERERTDVLTHLRLILSASELAILPFELSRIPTFEHAGTTPDGWLALDAPVCLTRHDRSVPFEVIRWPTRNPSILFVSGPDVPFAEHRAALIDAIGPWFDAQQPPETSDADPDSGKTTERFGRVLTIRENVSLRKLRQLIAQCRPTHVHILAHGGIVDEGARFPSFGVVLRDGVVAGDRLANAMVDVGHERVRMPAIVTLATCDSGNISSVVMPDASVAHELHRKGIPLVVASQFPLSEPGSVPFVRRFYQQQLWGEHPLKTLYDIRLELHSRFSHQYHDWASLVCYEALPANFADQREELRYWQSRAAQYHALDQFEAMLPDNPEGKPAAEWKFPAAQTYGRLRDKVAEALERLPARGPYAAECDGLRGAAYKRLAEVDFWLTCAPGAGKRRAALLTRCHHQLEESLRCYRRAAGSILASFNNVVHREVTLHWVLGQALSVEAMLGEPFDFAAWSTCELAAKTDLENPDETGRIWARVSLVELGLLRLGDRGLAAEDRAGIRAETLRNAAALLKLCGRAATEVGSTCRQLRRYDRWLGDQRFSAALQGFGLQTLDHWHEPDGVLETARELLKVFGGNAALRSAVSSGERRRRARTARTPRVAQARSVAKTLAGSVARTTSRSAKRSKAASKRVTGTLQLEMLPADFGDCIWLSYGKGKKMRNMLVDCGSHSAVDVLTRRIEALGPQSRRRIELFILTHIDHDHISGAIPLLRDGKTGVTFGDIWFNGWRQLRTFLSVRQGEAFSELLGDPARGLPWNLAATKPADKHPGPIVAPDGEVFPVVDLAGGMRVTVLAPRPAELKKLAARWQSALQELDPKKLLGRRAPPAPIADFDKFDVEKLAAKRWTKDSSIPNGSSIAVLAEFGGRTVLLTGDAHAPTLVESIQALQTQRGMPGVPLRLDAFKLSHHGSGNALNTALLEVVDCNRYLVSTDGTRFYHPDRESIARCIVSGGNNPLLCFNYKTDYNQFWGRADLRKRYGYRTQYPAAQDKGLKLDL